MCVHAGMSWTCLMRFILSGKDFDRDVWQPSPTFGLEVWVLDARACGVMSCRQGYVDLMTGSLTLCTCKSQCALGTLGCMDIPQDNCKLTATCVCQIMLVYGALRVLRVWSTLTAEVAIRATIQLIRLLHMLLFGENHSSVSLLTEHLPGRSS